MNHIETHSNYYIDTISYLYYYQIQLWYLLGDTYLHDMLF